MTDDAESPPRLLAALRASLAGVETDDRDQAAVYLAEMYAVGIDRGGALDTLGPKFLVTLVQLRLTPAGRGAPGDVPPARSPAAEAYDELKRHRDKRAGSA